MQRQRPLRGEAQRDLKIEEGDIYVFDDELDLTRAS